MKSTKSKLKKKLDKLCSEIVRKRGACERCNKQSNLQCAHIFSRKVMSLRWNFANLLCLCSGCHWLFAHQNPIEFTEWVKHYLGNYIYQSLRTKANETKKWSIKEMQNLYNYLLAYKIDKREECL